MKIGARVFKTGLSITVSVFLSILFIPDYSAALAGVAAITATMPSVRQSFNVFFKRVIANSLGGIVAVIMFLSIGNNPISIGIAAIFTIALLNYLKLGDVINLSVITVVAVMLTRTNNIYITAFYRVFETLIGVLVSLVINWLIYPPHYDPKFYKALSDLTSEMLVSIRATLRQNINFTLMHQDILDLQKSFKNIETVFQLMREELVFPKKKRLFVARRLVIYRHMLRLTKRTLQLVETFHKNDHVFLSFTDDLRQMVRRRLETLMAAHEQILMKFNGRVPANEVQFMTADMEYRQHYLDSFFTQAKHELVEEENYSPDVNGVIHIMSAIYKYEEELNRLNDLIRIYRERYNIEDGLEELPEIE